MEVQLLASIHSPYVVKYFDSMVENETLYIVMEYYKKNETTLESSRCWSLFIQMCLGLHSIHQQKVLHRDMKTANVFLTANDSDVGPRYFVKIGDLGVAKLLGTSTAFANTVVGTPYYLSPELCEDRPYNDKSDMWALGVILYECLTFKHPFEARNQCALILKIIKGKYTKIPEEHLADDNLKKLVALCLTHDCAQRPSVSDILSLDFVQEQANIHELDLPAAIPRCELKAMREEEEEEVEGREEEKEMGVENELVYPDENESPPHAEAIPQQPTTTPSKDTPKQQQQPRTRTPSTNSNKNSASPKPNNIRPRTTTPSSKYDKKRIITGVAARHASPTPTKSKTNVGSLGVNGVGAGSRTPNPSQNNAAGIRGNRVRGGNRSVSTVATTRHQRPQAEAKGVPRNLHQRSTTNRNGYARATRNQAEAKEQGLGGLMRVTGAGTASSSNLHAGGGGGRGGVGVVTVRRSTREDVIVPEHVNEVEVVVEGGEEDDGEVEFEELSESKRWQLQDSKEASQHSLPSTVGDEDEEVDANILASEPKGEGGGEEEGGGDEVQWEVIDENESKQVEDPNEQFFEQRQQEFDHDLFSSGDYNASPPQDIGVGVDGGGNPLYEVMEPVFDGEEEDDLDRTVGSEEEGGVEEEEEEEEVHIINNGVQDLRLRNLPPPGGAPSVSARVDLIGGMQKHVVDLDKLVSRATKQCRMVLGDAFDDLHEVFRERFIGDDGKMIADKDQSEEKTNEMHQYVENMQEELVARCGGIYEACSAVFNVQRLLALEAGLGEAKKNLKKALLGEPVMTITTPRVPAAIGDDGEETEGEDEEDEDEGYYEDDSFEEFHEETKEVA
ncbi:hypothetical protein TL16_g04166 [Triparma laevis f. inornata]|uniref:non-specific serine/threonine protein kinase n=1 Tax=Triparma laevis f. inornata TaxID=1714386 RepID=A0A9W7E3Z1_9STRA|nr:hypothetical protein TL16_g04166 [Triparma laevis f. inornata]